jgi:hypothetical protein
MKFVAFLSYLILKNSWYQIFVEYLNAFGGKIV